MPSAWDLQRNSVLPKAVARSAWGRWCAQLTAEALASGFSAHRAPTFTPYGPLFIVWDAPGHALWPQGGSKPPDVQRKIYAEEAAKLKKRFDRHFASRPKELRELKLWRDLTQEQGDAAVRLYMHGKPNNEITKALRSSRRLTIACRLVIGGLR